MLADSLVPRVGERREVMKGLTELWDNDGGGDRWDVIVHQVSSMGL